MPGVIAASYAGGGSTTVALPTHAVGNILVVFAFSNAASGLFVAQAGWTKQVDHKNTVVFYKTATSTTETIGTLTHTGNGQRGWIALTIDTVTTVYNGGEINGIQFAYDSFGNPSHGTLAAPNPGTRPNGLFVYASCVWSETASVAHSFGTEHVDFYDSAGTGCHFCAVSSSPTGGMTETYTATGNTGSSPSMSAAYVLIAYQQGLQMVI